MRWLRRGHWHEMTEDIDMGWPKRRGYCHEMTKEERTLPWDDQGGEDIDMRWPKRRRHCHEMTKERTLTWDDRRHWHEMTEDIDMRCPRRRGHCHKACCMYIVGVRASCRCRQMLIQSPPSHPYSPVPITLTSGHHNKLMCFPNKHNGRPSKQDITLLVRIIKLVLPISTGVINKCIEIMMNHRAWPPSLINIQPTYSSPLHSAPTKNTSSNLSSQENEKHIKYIQHLLPNQIFQCKWEKEKAISYSRLTKIHKN